MNIQRIALPVIAALLIATHGGAASADSRSEEDRARDAGRKPFDVVAFVGIKSFRASALRSKSHHASATRTPGVIVPEIDIRLMYWPLDAAGLSLVMSSISAEASKPSVSRVGR